MGRAVEVGRRPGRRRPGDGPAGLRLPRRAGRPRARDRPVPRVPRAADRRARPLGAASGCESAISPNERLQQLYHPWTSYVIVPLFALANAGIALSGELPVRRLHLADHARHPARLRARQADRHRRRRLARDALSRGRLRPPVGWAAVAGGGTIAGIGFTVSLLIATLAFDGEQLEEAKLGVLVGRPARLGCSPGSCSASPRCCRRGCKIRRCSADRRRSPTSPSPSTPSATTSAARSTRRSRSSSTATSSARTAARPSRSCASCSRDFGDVRYVWRHLPLNDVHPHAQLAAEAAEAAAAQGAFWEMHDLLLEHQDALSGADLIALREQLGLDVDRFREDLHQHDGRRAHRRGRRQRRPQRRLRHARRSSSTAAATTAPTTSRRSRPR